MLSLQRDSKQLLLKAVTTDFQISFLQQGYSAIKTGYNPLTPSVYASDAAVEMVKKLIEEIESKIKKNEDVSAKKSYK